MADQPARAPMPPGVYRLLCGRWLEQLRLLSTDINTQTKAVRALGSGWSQTKLVRIESGVLPIQDDELDALLALYGASDDDRDVITDYAERGRAEIPETDLRWKFAEDMRDVVDLEASAPVVRGYAGRVIPGLLQTEDYMRTILASSQPPLSRVETTKLVTNRLRRQAVLDQADQRFAWVIDESALARFRTGKLDRVAMHGQLLYLIELAGRPNIDLIIVPFTHGYYPAPVVEYTLFTFPAESQPGTHLGISLLAREHHTSVELVRNPKTVHELTTLWNQQHDIGLAPDNAVPFLIKLATTLASALEE